MESIGKSTKTERAGHSVESPTEEHINSTVYNCQDMATSYAINHAVYYLYLLCSYIKYNKIDLQNKLDTE